MPGNINNDNNLDNADAQWLLQHLAQQTGYVNGTEQGHSSNEL